MVAKTNKDAGLEHAPFTNSCVLCCTTSIGTLVVELFAATTIAELCTDVLTYLGDCAGWRSMGQLMRVVLYRLSLFLPREGCTTTIAHQAAHCVLAENVLYVTHGGSKLQACKYADRRPETCERSGGKVQGSLAETLQVTTLRSLCGKPCAYLPAKP